MRWDNNATNHQERVVVRDLSTVLLRKEYDIALIQYPVEVYGSLARAAVKEIRNSMIPQQLVVYTPSSL